MLAPVMIRLPREIVDRIEKIQASRMDKPNKSTVIRELLADALAAREKRAGRG